MVNESDRSAKDDASIEGYVREKLGAGGARIELACMTFDEEKLYPLDQGLNKVRVPSLTCTLAKASYCIFLRRKRLTTCCALLAAADCVA